MGLRWAGGGGPIALERSAADRVREETTDFKMRIYRLGQVRQEFKLC